MQRTPFRPTSPTRKYPNTSIITYSAVHTMMPEQCFVVVAVQSVVVARSFCCTFTDATAVAVANIIKCKTH